MSERPMFAKDLRLALADPKGVCAKPPSIATIRRWVGMGMPYVITPGQTRKQYLLSKCRAWVERNRRAE